MTLRTISTHLICTVALIQFCCLQLRHGEQDDMLPKVFNTISVLKKVRLFWQKANTLFEIKSSSTTNCSSNINYFKKRLLDAKNQSFQQNNHYKANWAAGDAPCLARDISGRSERSSVERATGDSLRMARAAAQAAAARSMT